MNLAEAKERVAEGAVCDQAIGDGLECGLTAVGARENAGDPGSGWALRCDECLKYCEGAKETFNTWHKEGRKEGQNGVQAELVEIWKVWNGAGPSVYCLGREEAEKMHLGQSGIYSQKAIRLPDGVYVLGEKVPSERERIRASALAKLTPEERKELGV